MRLDRIPTSITSGHTADSMKWQLDDTSTAIHGEVNGSSPASVRNQYVAALSIAL